MPHDAPGAALRSVPNTRHPNQIYDLQIDTGSGGWFNIQQAALQGGAVSNNPLFTGALGMYKGIILHENKRIPNGVNSSTSAAVANTRRALFLGAQSVNVCFGRHYSSKKRWSWVEKSFDYEKDLGVSLTTIWGCKASFYNSKFFGNLVISTYTSIA